MRKPLRTVLMMAVLSGLAMQAYADGHYVPGIEGVKAASVPPAGNYYIGYGVNYDINALKAPGTGTDIPGSNTGSVTAIAHRFVHMTNKKVLGADYGMEAIVPMVNKDFNFSAASYNNSKSGIADVYVGPVVLAWHGSMWDAAAAAGFTRLGNAPVTLSGAAGGSADRARDLAGTAVRRRARRCWRALSGFATARNIH